MVVAFHAGLPVPGGYLGVDVFFAISGFVITAMLASELESSGRIDLRRFYMRRIRRLLPALAAMVVLVVLVGALFSPAITQRITGLTGGAASLFAANIYLLGLGDGYFDPGSTLNPLLHTWTLGVEEQFYVLFPALLLLAALIARRLRRLGDRALAASAILAVCAASFLFETSLSSHAYAPGPVAPERLAFYASPARAWEFALGALVALAIPWARRLSSGAATLIGLGGLAAIAFAALSVKDAWGFEGTASLLPVCGTCALLAAGSAHAGGVSRLLAVRPAVWIGDLSYSWYLWHWPAIVFASAIFLRTTGPAAALVSLIPAWLSFRFVENPIRFGPRFGGRTLAAVAAACILVPLAACAGLYELPRALAGTGAMQRWQESQAWHADRLRGCDNSTPLGARHGDACTWTVAHPHGEIVLVGDSNAGHFTEPVVQAGRKAGYDVTVVTFHACPAIGLAVEGGRNGLPPAECQHFGSGTLETLVRRGPSLVVLASRSSLYIEDPSIRLASAGGPAAGSAAAKARLWRAELQKWIARLGDAHIPVLVAQPVPTFPDLAKSCILLRILRSGCSSSRPRAEVDEFLARAREADIAAVEANPNASAIDFEDSICGPRTCTASRDGISLYRDADHLSVRGALLLTNSFVDAIEAATRRERSPQ